MKAVFSRRMARRFGDIGSRLVAVGAALVFGVLTGVARGETSAAPHRGDEAHKQPLVKGLDASAIDKSADPCTDFYQYACGNWVRNNPVPADQVRWVRSFSLLQERTLSELRAALEVAATRPADPLERKYGDFYAACMDVEALQERGLEALKPAFDRISALGDARGIPALMRDLAADGNPAPPFALEVEPDPADSKKPVLTLSQAGLSLPDRETYGGDSPYVVKRYRSHVVRMFMLTGESLEEAGREAAAVLGIEKALAKASANRMASADPDTRYHVLSPGDLDTLAPELDFAAYFKRMTPAPVESLNVSNPEFVGTVNQLVTTVPVESWRSYFRWHVLSEQASALPTAYRDEAFAFWGANLGRQEKPAPRWKQCAAITEQAFGEALAQDWLKRNASPSARAGAEGLVEALEKALAGETRTVPWMNEETRRAAERKLAAIQNRIGHPQKWRDYAGLEVDRHDFLGNLHRAAVFERDHLLGRLGSPVDPDDWDMLPTRPGTHYARSMNSLYISAGLLQPPFFDSAADPAVNFGGLGVMAAHELTHGFDSLGSKFDERGNVRDWQTPDDRKAFADATSCEVAQYINFMPKSDDPQDPPLVKGKGRFAVAESTADNGGLRIAFRALMDVLVAQGRTADSRVDGYTERQRFFLSFAQASCENQTFFSSRQSMTADPRSAGWVRVNGAVQNFEEFGKAFRCTKGTPMYPASACRVW